MCWLFNKKMKFFHSRMKPQSLTPPSSDSGHSPTSALPLSPSSSSQGVKRPHEETLDPTVKRSRGSRWTSTRSCKSNDARSEANSDTNPESRLSILPNNKSNSSSLNSCSESKQVGAGRHHHQDERPLINGTTSPARKPSTSPISQSSPRHRLNGIHSHHSSGNHSPINGVTNGLTNGHGNPHHRMNGHIRSEPSTPNSSPDSHHGGEDTIPEYQKYVLYLMFYLISLPFLC